MMNKSVASIVLKMQIRYLDQGWVEARELERKVGWMPRKLVENILDSEQLIQIHWLLLCSCRS
ncbi:hypothetical protein Ancab_028588 [Ancistrocladus abbreviatus]